MRWTPEDGNLVYRTLPPGIRGHTLEIDAFYMYCDNKWKSTKIPDGSTCKLTCSKYTDKDGKERWTINTNCWRSRITKYLNHDFDMSGKEFLPPDYVKPRCPIDGTVSCSGTFDGRKVF
jgi:hypothetical protein